MSLPVRIVLSTVLLNTMFFIPVAVLYYQYKGIAIDDIFILLALYRLLMMAFEVPAGYLADRWQRHHQLMVAGALCVVTFICIFLAKGFWPMAAAFAVAAFADAMHSGTNEAYLHESLRAMGREADAPRWQGYLFAGGLAAEGLTAVAGGWLYGLYVHAPMLATIFTCFIGFLIALTFPMAPRIGDRRHDNPWDDLKAVVRWSMREHPRLPSLIIGPRLLFGYTGTLFWAMQLRLTELKVSPLWLGLYLAGYFVVKTIAASLMDRVHARAGEARMLVGLVVLLAVGVVMMATSYTPWAVWLGGVLSAGLVHALGQPLATSLINSEVSDTERATVLSCANLISGLYGGLLMLAVGPLLRLAGYENMLFASLGLTLLLSIHPLIRLIRG